MKTIAACCFMFVFGMMIRPVDAGGSWGDNWPWYSIWAVAPQVFDGYGGGVLVSTNEENHASCTEKKHAYFLFDNEVSKSMFALLLTAKATGKRVLLCLDNNGCLYGYSKITGVSLIE